jgi:hypothetical protein
MGCYVITGKPKLVVKMVENTEAAALKREPKYLESSVEPVQKLK